MLVSLVQMHFTENMRHYAMFIVVFFQAEDGIRDLTVTGVQTCALPICSNRSPIWVGGGKTFAAKPRDFTQKVNRKMYRGAIRSMLSELARTERLLVTDGIQLAAPKTRLLAQQLKAWELPSVLIVVEASDEKLVLAARNLPHVEVIEVPALNPLSLAAYDKVLMTVGAVKLIEERLQ